MISSELNRRSPVADLFEKFCIGTSTGIPPMAIGREGYFIASEKQLAALGHHNCSLICFEDTVASEMGLVVGQLGGKEDHLTPLPTRRAMAKFRLALLLNALKISKANLDKGHSVPSFAEVEWEANRLRCWLDTFSLTSQVLDNFSAEITATFLMPLAIMKNHEFFRSEFGKFNYLSNSIVNVYG